MENTDKDRNNINQNTGNLGNGKDNDDTSKRDIDDSTEAKSRTYNQDEESWKQEKEGKTTNQGTKNNDWDDKDQLHRGTDK